MTPVVRPQLSGYKLHRTPKRHKLDKSQLARQDSGKDMLKSEQYAVSKDSHVLVKRISGDKMMMRSCNAVMTHSTETQSKKLQKAVSFSDLTITHTHEEWLNRLEYFREEKIRQRKDKILQRLKSLLALCDSITLSNRSTCDSSPGQDSSGEDDSIVDLGCFDTFSNWCKNLGLSCRSCRQKSNGDTSTTAMDDESLEVLHIF